MKISNLHESREQNNKNGLGKVIARKGAKKNQVIIPNERESMTVLTIINAAKEYLSHFYIFKGTRATREYVSKCEEGAMSAMQKKGWMDAHLFSRWMDQFIEILEDRKLFSLISRHLIVLDGYKSHVTLDVIAKAKQHEVDFITLPSHTSHEL